MKIVILITLLTLVCSHPLYKNMIKFIGEKPAKEQFKLWHYIFNRPYDINTETGLERYKIFKQNLKMIQEHNSKNLSYKLGLGPFTDYTYEEVKRSILREQPKQFIAQQKQQEKSFSFDALADDDEEEVKQLGDHESPDYSYLYQSVKNQGGCGSCWIFSAVGFLEGHVAMSNNNQQIRLSEQFLLDCIKVDWSSTWTGCSGGAQYFALDKIKEFGGIPKESDYNAYTASAGTCPSQNTIKKTVVLKSYKQCGNTNAYNPRCTEAEYRELSKKGPFSASLNVGSMLIHYSEGEFSDENSCLNYANHAIVVVQYKVKNGHKTFKFRNSWGPEWGESGYGYIRVSKDSQSNEHGCNIQYSSQHKPEFVLN
jgi:C1A family cysteine protease